MVPVERGVPGDAAGVTSVILPFHSESQARNRAASWVKLRLQALHPSWPLAVASGGCEPWSKARAVNTSSARAEIFVVIDADVALPAEALEWAVAHVEEHGGWAVPYGQVYRLHAEATAEVLASLPTVEVVAVPDESCGHRKPYWGVPGGGCFVVSREAWETVGGFDERFDGWGYEDTALGHALDTLASPHARLSAPLWHLWHPQAPRDREAVAGNHALQVQYQRARGNVGAMRSLTDQHKGTRVPRAV